MIIVKEKLTMTAGEIYYINYSGKFRPAIIINDTGDSCIIAPLTTLKAKLADRQYKIIPDHSNGLENGPVYINLKDISSVNKTRINNRVGIVNGNDLLNITNLIKERFSNEINSLKLNLYAESELEKNGLSIVEILTESHSTTIDTKFDIFLSHSSLDKKELAGLVTYFQSLGYSIYVDWIEDPHIDREKVTRDTAQLMRKRMSNSRTLLFAFSKNSRKSVWMPWELGYFDGMSKNIAIMPIERVPFYNKRFKGQEYLDLYDCVEQGEMDLDHDGLLVVSHENNSLPLRMWIKVASFESTEEQKLSS